MGQYDDASDILGWALPRKTIKRMPIAVRYGAVYVPDAPLRTRDDVKKTQERQKGERMFEPRFCYVVYQTAGGKFGYRSCSVFPDSMPALLAESLVKVDGAVQTWIVLPSQAKTGGEAVSLVKKHLKSLSLC